MKEEDYRKLRSLFFIHKGKREEVFFGILLARVTLAKGDPIDKELYPYLIKSCDSWLNDKNGGKRQKSRLTEDFLLQKVIAVSILMNAGKKLDDACREVVRRADKHHPNIKSMTSKSLKSRYTAAKFKHHKERTSIIFLDLKDAYDMSDTKLAEHLLEKIGFPK